MSSQSRGSGFKWPQSPEKDPLKDFFQDESSSDELWGSFGYTSPLLSWSEPQTIKDLSGKAPTIWSPPAFIQDLGNRVTIEIVIPNIIPTSVSSILDANTLTVLGKCSVPGSGYQHWHDPITGGYSRQQIFSWSYLMPAEISRSDIRVLVDSKGVSIELPKKPRVSTDVNLADDPLKHRLSQVFAFSSPVEKDREDEIMSANRDKNYQAYLKEAADLGRRFPDHLVAYADGARIALAKDARELMEKIPAEYRKRALFIKEVPERVFTMRRPLRTSVK